jgi:hypothetical protein
MDFNLTEEQLMIQQAARDFAQSELLPGWLKNFQSSLQSRSKKWQSLVLWMMVDPKYGSGLDSVSYVWQLPKYLKFDSSYYVC